MSLEDGREDPLALVLGRPMEWKYSGNKILWKGVPVRPKLGFLRLLQVPSDDRYFDFSLQDGSGLHGQCLSRS